MKKYKVVREEPAMSIRTYEYIVEADSKEEAVKNVENDLNVIDVEMIRDDLMDIDETEALVIRVEEITIN